MTYDHPIYVVLPLGDGSGAATDEDIRATQEALRPFITHVVTDPRLCGQITGHLLIKELRQ